MKVVCIKWGEKYGPKFVTRLQSMVAKHLQCEHEFICFTDKPVESVHCEPLPSDHPTWWSKIGLFKPGLLSGENLYLDLDVIVTGDLSVFRRDDNTVWALDDFSYSLRKPKPGAVSDPYLGGIGTCNSSVMSWRGDAGRRIWDSFAPEVMTRLHGDQNHITQALWPEGLSLYPEGLACSYKYHVLNGKQKGSVIVFHGNPKATSLEQKDPLRLLWEAA